MSPTYENLGLKTDLMIVAMDGSVERCEGHSVATWPTLPGYRWGNILVFDAPPKEGDLQRWKALFEAAHGAGRHYSFAWHTRSGDMGVIEPFFADGFSKEAAMSLVSAGPLAEPPRLNRELSVRPLSSDADWARVVAINRSEDPDPYDATASDSFRDFIERRLARYRAMVEAGHGGWFGAFTPEGQLAGSCGIFVGPEGTARYQEVVVHPDHRRRGVATRLVRDVGHHALAELGAERLVITASVGSSALRIYKRLGFEEVDLAVGVIRPPEA